MPSRRTASRHLARQRGSALLTAMVLTGVMLLGVLAIVFATQKVELRGIAQARRPEGLNCAEAGLSLARDYYVANFSQWTTFLSQPNYYDPVSASWMTGSTTNQGPATSLGSASLSTGLAALETAHPELFVDLDADGQPDVYLYIRDNVDEFFPATNNYLQDNDSAVIIGAACISPTLRPRLSSGGVDPSIMVAEGLLTYNVQTSYKTQSGAGATGNGNLN